jgi:hypothetical protein
MCGTPRAAHDGPMLINHETARLLVEERHNDLRTAARGRWSRPRWIDTLRGGAHARPHR